MTQASLSCANETIGWRVVGGAVLFLDILQRKHVEMRSLGWISEKKYSYMLARNLYAI